MSDITRKLELIKDLERMVQNNPDFFDVGVKGLMPLEKLYLKLVDLGISFRFEQLGLEVVTPTAIIRTDSEDN